MTCGHCACGSILCRYKRCLILLLTPLVLIPIPAVIQTKESFAAYILVLMAVYWMTEVLPLGITGLIPIVLGPAFRILTSKKLCPNYMNDANVLFLGGLMVATAVERWNLHKRIALAVLMVMGTSHRRLMLGFMLPTWFLSMWISNTATTAMMIPIVEAVLSELRQHPEEFDLDNYPLEEIRDNKNYRSKTPENKIEPSDVETIMPGDQVMDEKSLNLGKAMTLCIAYSASCGGIGTITGTGPNLVVYNLISSNYGSKSNLNFGTWMIYAIPISFVTLIGMWMWIQLWFFGPREFVNCKRDPGGEARIKEVIKRNYKALGPVTFAEGSCMFFLALLVFLWVSKNPGIPGWIVWFTDGDIEYATDSTPVILITILLFMWPSYNPFSSRKSKEFDLFHNEMRRPIPEDKTILSWRFVHIKFPWNIMLLSGGGFALAVICEESGLSAWIGKQLIVLQNVPLALLVMLITLGTACFTEIASNMTTATVLLPILNELAKCIGVHPFFLLLPTAVACSLAFCLPVATPPNAIVFTKGYVRVPDMAKCGLVMNIFAVLVVTGATLSYGSAFFNLNVQPLPDWVGKCSTNMTV